MVDLADKYYTKLKHKFNDYEIDYVALDREYIYIYFKDFKFITEQKNNFPNLKIIKTKQKGNYMLCSYPINKLV